MPTLYRKITKRFVVIINLIAAMVYLAAGMAIYVHPVQYWYIALLGFAFPYIIIIILAFAVLWGCFKSKWLLLNVAVMLITYNSISVVVALHPFASSFTQEKKTNAIRILHWNTMCFAENMANRVEGSEIREKMLQYIKESDADVLCLQEFYDSDLPQYNNNIKYLTYNLGYPNYIYTKDYVRHTRVDTGGVVYAPIGYLGTAIFTKLPMIDSGRIAYSEADNQNKESIAYLDLLKNNDTIRIYTAHLKSINLAKTEYNEVYKIKDANATGLQASKNVFVKIKKAYTYRSKQAELLRLQIETSPYPVILTGDFNDIPNSYTYNTIKGSNMQDAYIKYGFGIGRTFSAISPTLRIDYAFADDAFSILQSKKENKNLSDHYPIVLDVALKGNIAQ